MTRIIRTVLLVLALLVATAAPAVARDHRAKDADRDRDREMEHEVLVEDDDVEPVQVLSLLVAGMALTTAVAALVYGRTRAPQ